MMARVTSDLPPPRDIEAHVGELVVELAQHLGEPAVVSLCVELLEGADAHEHLPGAGLPHRPRVRHGVGRPRPRRLGGLLGA